MKPFLVLVECESFSSSSSTFGHFEPNQFKNQIRDSFRLKGASSVRSSVRSFVVFNQVSGISCSNLAIASGRPENAGISDLNMNSKRRFDLCNHFQSGGGGRGTKVERAVRVNHRLQSGFVRSFDHLSPIKRTNGWSKRVLRSNIAARSTFQRIHRNIGMSIQSLWSNFTFSGRIVSFFFKTKAKTTKLRCCRSGQTKVERRRTEDMVRSRIKFCDRPKTRHFLYS